MSYYDVLFGVILRLSSPDGKDIFNDIDSLNQFLGETIKTQFTDLMVVPLGMELVEDDMQIRILNKINYNDELPEEDNAGDEL